MKKGRYIDEMALAGGMDFPLITGGIVRSSNLTPHKETGIGNWSKEQFISHFKKFSGSSFYPARVNHGDFNTVMPWEYYSKLNDTDLEAIYTYLMSLDPIENKFEKFSP